jgi:hypothetical protein
MRIAPLQMPYYIIVLAQDLSEMGRLPQRILTAWCDQKGRHFGVLTAMWKRKIIKQDTIIITHRAGGDQQQLRVDVHRHQPLALQQPAGRLHPALQCGTVVQTPPIHHRSQRGRSVMNLMVGDDSHPLWGRMQPKQFDKITSFVPFIKRKEPRGALGYF